MKSYRSLLIVLSVLLIAAQQQRPDAESYIKLLESERRVEGLQVDRVIETLKVSPGQKVADIGAGSGLFTRPIAKKTGSKGMVYAIDIDLNLLKHIAATSKAENLSNVHTVVAAENDPKIPEKVDLIIIIDTLHHIDNRDVYLKNLRRYLRPSGRIAIIDFSRDWPPGHEQMKFTLDQLEEWMKASKYERVEKHDFLDNNFFVIYK